MSTGRGDNLARRIRLLGRDRRCKFHTLPDAGTQFWPSTGNESPECFPGLFCLHNPKRLAPFVEPIKSDRHLSSLRQN